MSRTKKDRPDWVISNDKTFDRRQEKHNHTRFGVEIWRTRFMFDDEGNQIRETYTEVDDMWDERFHDWVKIETVHHFYPRERYLADVTAEECTINEPLTDNYRWFYDRKPCTHVIYYTKKNRPRSDEKKTFHSQKRSAERTPLHVAAKLYNSHENIEGYDNPELNNRINMHHGYWY
jgi:hypothetical protein